MHARGRTLVGGGSIESDTSLNMAACLRSAVRRTTGAETSPAASFSVSLEGTSKNRSYSSDATKLSANDSASFPFRFMDVHARAARDPHREQFFEVPIRMTSKNRVRGDVSFRRSKRTRPSSSLHNL